MCPSIVRDFYGALASIVRQCMTTEGIDCATARKLVAARVLQRAVDPKDTVKSQVCCAALPLLKEAGGLLCDRRDVDALGRL